jgi:hypothetical protein
MRRRVPALVAAGAAAALAAAGVVWVLGHPVVAEPSELVVGRYTSEDLLPLADVTILDGAYRVGFSAEVQFFSSDPRAELYCAVIDTAGTIGYLQRTLAVVPGTGEWTRIEEYDTVELPGLTLGLRCRPSTSGTIGFAYRAVDLTAVPLAR